jgi:hypothetical protein
MGTITNAADLPARRLFSNRDLTWRGEKLCLGSKALVAIVPDAQYPGMWRVRSGDTLSDMVNLSRARDAARALALSLLNKGDMQERGVAASSMRQKDIGHVLVAGAEKISIGGHA